MSHSTHSVNEHNSTSGRDAWLDPFYRKAFLNRLENLREGRLIIIDDSEKFEFGSPADLEAEVKIIRPEAYRKMALGGSLGAAEAYIDGDWECDGLTSLFRLFVRNMDLWTGMESGLARWAIPVARIFHRLRANTKQGSRKNIHEHYDLGNEFFRLFLDETMTYSAAIFDGPDCTLREASENKLDRICRKLELGPEDHVVEIGTGWGSFALHAAGRYDCKVTTTTISREQYDLAGQRVKEHGLEDRVTVLLKDYRDLEGTYDKLVSIEMIEAVGEKFLPVYFKKCAELLKPDGQMLIQAITMADWCYEEYRHSVDFTQKYIFPGSFLPSIGNMANITATRTDLRFFHLEDITPHYGRTLHEWHRRFLAKLDDVHKQGFSDRFIRLWEYYLTYCEAGFTERFIGNVQLLLTKPKCRRESITPALGDTA